MKGSLRGGHAHTVNEVVLLLTGGMAYHKKGLDGTEYIDTVKAGEGSFNRSGVFHMGEFLEDSWLIEWKLNTRKGEWKNVDYPAWRERVAANTAG